MSQSQKAGSKAPKRSPAPPRVKSERTISDDDLESVAGGQSTKITNGTFSTRSTNPHIVPSKPKVLINS